MIHVQLLTELTPDIVDDLRHGFARLKNPMFTNGGTFDDALNFIVSHNAETALIQRDGKTIGVAHAYAIERNHSATVHFVVWELSAWWSRSLRSTLEGIIAWFVDKYNLKRLTITTPRSYKFANFLARTLNFKLEGVMKLGILVDGTAEDMMVYGKLFENVREPDTRSNGNGRE